MLAVIGLLHLRFYKLDDKGLATDCVMALALAAYAWKRRNDANIFGDDLWGEQSIDAVNILAV